MQKLILLTNILVISGIIAFIRFVKPKEIVIPATGAQNRGGNVPRAILYRFRRYYEIEQAIRAGGKICANYPDGTVHEFAIAPWKE